MTRVDTRIKGFICAALLGLLLALPASAAERSYAETPDHTAVTQMIENMVAQAVLGDVARLFGLEAALSCIPAGEISLCLAPDTPPEKAEELLRLLPTWTGDRYTLANRWTVTATDGSVGGFGVPVTLTYSFLPDGTWIPPAGVGAGAPSSLYAEMNSHFGSPDVWKPLFADIYNSWGQHVGITYFEVDDDGASFPNSPGVLNYRGDVRIGAKYLDGGSNVLGYSYFPNNSDTVFDTSENWGNASNDYRFLRNVTAHEHGHGIGLNHPTPNSCTKLMEAYLCLNFTGPQDDDIRGGMRWYGDFLEPSDDAGEAVELGAFSGEQLIAIPSLDCNADTDWYHFLFTEGGFLSVTLHPVGSAYQVNGQVVFTHKTQDLEFALRDGVNGSNIILTVNDTIEGYDEVLIDYTLAAGEYWLSIDGDGLNDVQRYELTVTANVTSVLDNGQPMAGLGLSIYPNPFNPKTVARFYAPAAGIVTLDVYNVAGGLVRSMDTAAASAGWMEITWNGKDNGGHSVPSGIYFMRAKSGGESETVRAVLLK